VVVRSGAVDAGEMTKMVKALKMKMSPADIKKMIADADPDGSGEVIEPGAHQPARDWRRLT
jgi:Ca2+-binding EF-hand superfamily protein